MTTFYAVIEDLEVFTPSAYFCSEQEALEWLHNTVDGGVYGDVLPIEMTRDMWDNILMEGRLNLRKENIRRQKGLTNFVNRGTMKKSKETTN